jgi:tryptophan 2-monooxygenase
MIPSLDAFGGWGRRRRRNPANTTLADLYRPTWRFVDSPYFEYKSFLRNAAGTAYPSLSLNPSVPLLPGTRVGIVGGGIAGLVAAYELTKLGATVSIFEATARLGGRMYTINWGNGALAEMGAMRVPESARLFWHYLGQMLPGTTPMTAFPNPGVVATLLNYGSVLRTWGGAAGGSPGGIFDTIIYQLLDPNNGAYNTQIVYYGATIDDIYRILASASPSQAELELVALWWARAIRQFDKKTFLEATLELVVEAGYPAWDNNMIEAFATLGFGTGGFGPLFPVSFLEILRLIIWRYDTEYEVPGGMARMIDWFAAEITRIGRENGNPPTFYVSTPVDRVIAQPDRVTVQDASGTQRTFDFVIATGTGRGMQRYGLDLNGATAPFDPANVTQGGSSTVPVNLVSSTQNGMREVNMVGASKVFQLYSTKPWIANANWPKNSVGEPVKTVLADKVFRQSYFLDPSPNDNSAPVVGLISYAWNNESTKVAALTPVQRQALYKKAYDSSTTTAGPMQVIGASIQPNASNIASLSWENEPHMLGAFKLDAPNGYYRTASLVFHYTLGGFLAGTAATSWQRVYLAGDTMSFYGGWIEGAMMSAINAVTGLANARLHYTYAQMQAAIRSAVVMDWTKAWGYGTAHAIQWQRIGTA